MVGRRTTSAGMHNKDCARRAGEYSLYEFPTTIKICRDAYALLADSLKKVTPVERVTGVCFL